MEVIVGLLHVRCEEVLIDLGLVELLLVEGLELALHLYLFLSVAEQWLIAIGAQHELSELFSLLFGFDEFSWELTLWKEGGLDLFVALFLWYSFLGLWLLQDDVLECFRLELGKVQILDVRALTTVIMVIEALSAVTTIQKAIDFLVLNRSR